MRGDELLSDIDASIDRKTADEHQTVSTEAKKRKRGAPGANERAPNKYQPIKQPVWGKDQDHEQRPEQKKTERQPATKTKKATTRLEPTRQQTTNQPTAKVTLNTEERVQTEISKSELDQTSGRPEASRRPVQRRKLGDEAYADVQRTMGD